MACKNKIKNKGVLKRLSNPWQKHIATEKTKFPKKYAGKSVGEVAKLAKKSYIPLTKKK